ncbi:MAG TPA: flagellar protein FlgN, partial [Burkholderiales bacterium]|nr:flagellar protein FlgN [Burkholderiales bacterium]
GEFCQLLEAEHASLQRSDVEELLKITQLKLDKVDRLAELATVRTRYLDSAGLTTGREGMVNWMARLAGAEASEVSNVWRELVDFAAKARTLNDSNGTLITTRMSHNQAALAAMQSAARTHSLYGPDGQASVATGNRNLGTA